MERLLTVAALVAALLGIGFPTAATTLEKARNHVDGDYFTTLCSSQARTHMQLCEAYVISVTHAISYSPVDGYRACVPNFQTTWGRVKDVVYAWIGHRPELHHVSAVTLIALALADTYPCPEDKFLVPVPTR